MEHTNALNRFMTALLNSIFGVIIFILSAAAFFLPYEIAIIPKVAAFITPVRTVCGGILIICFILLFASKLHLFRDNWFMVALIAFLAVLIYSTSINQVDMQGALSDSGLYALFNAMLLAVFLKVNPRRYLLIFYFIYFIVTILNTYTVFATAGVGMWREWQTYLDPTYSLVGNFNLGIMYVMPMIIAGTVWASKYGKWLEIINYIAIVASIAMAFKCSSDTQVLVFGLTLFVMILNDIMHAFKGMYKVLQIFNSAVLFGVDLALFFIAVVYNKMDFIAKLGYEGDFHGRLKIWEVSKSWIMEKPVWGNGVETLDYTASKWMPITDAGHSHCFFLEVPYQSGFLGTLFFFAMIVLVIIAVFRAKNIHTKWLLSGFIGLTFLAALVESYPMVFMIIVLALCYYIAHSDREEALEMERLRQRERARYRATAERKRTRYRDDV